MTTEPLPVYFISHGGGPWPWMKEQTQGAYDRLEASLQAMPAQVGMTPAAILMVSAHWEEDAYTVMAAAEPPMIYDYSNFPAHTYQIRYPAPGAPRVAERARALLAAASLPVRVDASRGFDHGTYSPLAAAWPRADVPVLQLSIRRDYDPAGHLALGRALAPLREEGVLIVGSGLSYHNLRAFGPSARAPSAAFDRWLQQTVVGTSATARATGLVQWESAPAARLAHPREEHLIPLMVAAGAALDDTGRCVYHEEDFYGGLSVSSFAFGLSDRAAAAAERRVSAVER